MSMLRSYISTTCHPLQPNQLKEQQPLCRFELGFAPRRADPESPQKEVEK